MLSPGEERERHRMIGYLAALFCAGFAVPGPAESCGWAIYQNGAITDADSRR